LNLVCTDKLPHDRTAHLVDGFVGHLLNVKSVENDLCLRDLFPHGTDECRGHVHGDDLDLFALLQPQFLEEGIEGVRALALGTCRLS